MSLLRRREEACRKAFLQCLELEITSVNRLFLEKLLGRRQKRLFLPSDKQMQQLRALCPAQGENLYALRTTVTKTAGRETVCSEPSHVPADPAKSTLLSTKKSLFLCVTSAGNALTHDKSRILPASDEEIIGMPVVLAD